MALYRHFATKEELINALLDRVLGRFAAEPPSDDWVDDLRHFARAHRQLLDQHPWALTGLFSHPNPGLNATIIGEVALEILSRARLANDSVVATFSGLLALNYGWSAFAAARDALPANAAAQVRQALAALPRSEYPTRPLWPRKWLPTRVTETMSWCSTRSWSESGLRLTAPRIRRRTGER